MTEEITLTSKIFQGLFSDADYHLDQAEYFHSIVKQSAARGPLNADQVALGKARAHGRACIVTVIAGTESLCVCLEDLLRTRAVEDLPADWIPKNQRGRMFRFWPLVLKVRFIPVLCCDQLRTHDSYFRESDVALRELEEMVKIRNRIVHGGKVTTRYTIDFGENNLHTVRDDFPDNFWDITHFPTDIRSLSYDEANQTYTLVLELARQMVAYLDGKVTLAFLRDADLLHSGREYTAQQESVDETVPRWCRILLGGEP
jgi:hypothetical protein